MNYPLEGMNDYQRLEHYGWECFHMAKRFDYYKKTDKRGNKWVAIVPLTISYSIMFEKNGKRLQSNKKQ